MKIFTQRCVFPWLFWLGYRPLKANFAYIITISQEK